MSYEERKLSDDNVNAVSIVNDGKETTFPERLQENSVETSEFHTQSCTTI